MRSLVFLLHRCVSDRDVVRPHAHSENDPLGPGSLEIAQYNFSYEDGEHARKRNTPVTEWHRTTLRERHCCNVYMAGERGAANAHEWGVLD